MRIRYDGNGALRARTLSSRVDGAELKYISVICECRRTLERGRSGGDNSAPEIVAAVRGDAETRAARGIVVDTVDPIVDGRLRHRVVERRVDDDRGRTVVNDRDQAFAGHTVRVDRDRRQHHVAARRALHRHAALPERARAGRGGVRETRLTRAGGSGHRRKRTCRIDFDAHVRGVTDDLIGPRVEDGDDEVSWTLARNGSRV